jgi:hypothetical protein
MIRYRVINRISQIQQEAPKAPQEEVNESREVPKP